MKPGIHYPETATDGEIFRLFVIGPLQDWLYLENIHFTPQWRDILACSWPYDLVVEYERISAYQPWIQRLTGTEEYLWPGSRKEQGVDEHESMYFVDQYMRALGEEERGLIYKLYKRDYEMLGYTKYGEEGFPFLKV